MEKYHPQKDLAPRDIVSRAVFAEMERTGSKCVYLDCTSIDKKKMKTHFPTISKKCNELGIDLQHDSIPVKPAAHYMCGGIDTDLDGATSVKNLYAIGECANTGLHGANRLASNSLLEALVMAHRCCAASAETKDIKPPSPFPESPSMGIESYQEIRLELRAMMEAHAGIIRNNINLKAASARLKQMADQLERAFLNGELSTEGYELRNMIAVATLIVKQSLERKSNIGGYFNTDLVADQLSVANHSA
jgi:L-aspartate oxidase